MIAVREQGTAVIVEVEGEFAERVVDEFGGVIASLMEQDAVRVVLNLRRASWTSLKALKWLVGEAKKLREVEGDLKLAALNPYLSNLLELTGTRTLFDIYPSVDEAVAAYGVPVVEPAGMPAAA